MGEEPGGHAIHTLGPSRVELDGDRALVDTPCAILFRRTFAGVECDMTAYCRHHSRVERVDGRWRLVTFVGVYEKNTLVPTIPGVVPRIDEERLATFRASYAFQSYSAPRRGSRSTSTAPAPTAPTWSITSSPPRRRGSPAPTSGWGSAAMRERAPQVLVVGGGLAGHTAALSAAQAGAEVLLLEKQEEFGGSSVLAGGGLAFAGTELQRSSGVGYTPQQLADDLTTAGGGRSDPALVAAYVREQAAVYRWLCTLGAAFDLTGEPVRRLHTMPSGALVRLLHTRVLAEPRITYRAATPVASLRTTDDVRVVGGGLADGTQLRADAVVLTTGGFSRNADLVARLAPQCAGAVAMGGLGNDGDGLLMATEHGAALAGMADVQASFGASVAAGVPPRLLYPHLDGAVIVNVLGERFADERSDIKALGGAVAQQPRGLAYQVFDQAVMERSRETPTPRDFAAAQRDGLLVEAGTLADLAAAIGLPAPALADSAGDQARPPFYAFACRAGLTSTYGGLRVDPSMRVLDTTGRHLPGLYAAGELVGGFHGAGYVIGTALGKAAVFGHIAGREAALHRPVCADERGEVVSGVR